jgi:hypothetical protein
MADFSLVPSGHGSNYTGMLTRSIVFTGALILFLITTGMTIASIAIPEWISYDTTTVSTFATDLATDSDFATGSRHGATLVAWPPSTMLKHERPTELPLSHVRLEDALCGISSLLRMSGRRQILLQHVAFSGIPHVFRCRHRRHDCRRICHSPRRWQATKRIRLGRIDCAGTDIWLGAGD